MLSQKLLIHYGHNLLKIYSIPSVNDFLFIFTTKFLLIKVVHESFLFVLNNM